MHGVDMTNNTDTDDRSLRLRAAAGVMTAVAIATTTIAWAAPAGASGDDAIRATGSCSGSAVCKLKAKHDDGRLEVEFEVDSNRVGQTWRWKLWHNGSLTGKGTRRTKGDSGSFEVERVIVDMAGTDWSTFKARNIRSGEICRGVVGY
jgi:hypothetical protein